MVRLKLKGEFYYVHPEDLETVRVILGEKREGEIKIPLHQMPSILSSLVKDKGHKVEEYIDMNGEEVIVRQASPGNWTEFAEYLLDDTDISKAAGVFVQRRGAVQTVYLACISVLEKTVSLFSFEDTEIFTNLAQVLYEENVKEIAYTDKQLEKVFRAVDISYRYINEAIRREQPMERAEGLVEKMLNIRMNGYKRQEKTQTGIMRMDESVANALLDGEVTLWGEIKCSTAQGKRLLRTMLRAPLTNKEEIERRHAIVEEMIPVAESINMLLKKAPDVMLICKRLDKKSTGLAGIIKIVEIVKIATELIGKVKNMESLSLEAEILQEACENSVDIFSIVDEAIDLSAQSIKHTYTERLKELHSIKSAQEKDIYFELNQEIEKKKLYRNKAKIEKNVMHGYCIKVPRKESACVSSYGLISLSILKTGSLFTTDTIRKLDLKIKKTLGEIEIETEQAVSMLKERIGWYKEWLEVINQIIATIDVFVSFAQFAKQNHLVRPKITEKEYMICKAYHPLLPAIHRRNRLLGQSPPPITKNDFSLIESRFCVITGPNMGGKTTFLKTIALISIMAQLGSFVPAEKAALPIFTSLFIRIGAADMPEKNISTFMAEMNDVSKILNQADSKSLVIIDELGRGTSDADGYAIAHATVEYIISLNAITLFATHFHDICQIPGVCNKRVGIIMHEKEKPIMTYKIEDGISTESHGINTAKQAGFPEEVISAAENALVG